MPCGRQAARGHLEAGVRPAWQCAPCWEGGEGERERQGEGALETAPATARPLAVASPLHAPRDPDTHCQAADETPAVTDSSYFLLSGNPNHQGVLRSGLDLSSLISSPFELWLCLLEPETGPVTRHEGVHPTDFSPGPEHPASPELLSSFTPFCGFFLTLTRDIFRATFFSLEYQQLSSVLHFLYVKHYARHLTDMNLNP